MIIPPKAATACGLILNELFTNAYKYRFRKDKEGVLDISFLEVSKNQIEMKVYNDGMSTESEEIFRLNSSFGLTMVDILVGQLEGELIINLELGTEFVIKFSLDDNT